MSLVTNANGGVVSRQDFDPWGGIRSGSISQTTLNDTGQRRDATGLLYYHARYYDPVLGRFVSADSVVPGAPDGSMDGVALKPLTVDFHEPGFVSGLNAENGQGFWFQHSDQVAPWGPQNPQALNRYAYVQNNPVRYTDPTGHCTKCYYGPVGLQWLFAKFANWLGDKWSQARAQRVFDAGQAVTFLGADGVARTIRSAVKTGPQGLFREANKIGKQQSQEINQLMHQFLNGNPNPGIGTKHLTKDIFYLRGREGGRVFLRRIGENNYEIIGYADKHNEQRVINMILEYYTR